MITNKKMDKWMKKKGSGYSTRRGLSAHEPIRAIVMYDDEVSDHTFQFSDKCPKGCKDGHRSGPRVLKPYVIDSVQNVSHLGTLGLEADIHRRSWILTHMKQCNVLIESYYATITCPVSK